MPLCSRQREKVNFRICLHLYWLTHQLQAKNQTTVAQSTVEAENVAMARATKEAIWQQYLLQALRMSEYEPTVRWHIPAVSISRCHHLTITGGTGKLR
jgi:hypothetical protein